MKHLPALFSALLCVSAAACKAHQHGLEPGAEVVNLDLTGLR